MSADNEKDDFGRPWGKPLWEGGPVNGGTNWREFVPLMLARRRGEATREDMERRSKFQEAARKLGAGRWES